MNKIARILANLSVDDQDVISNCAARGALYLIEDELVGDYQGDGPGTGDDGLLAPFQVSMEQLLGREPTYREGRLLERCVDAYLADRVLLAQHAEHIAA